MNGLQRMLNDINMEANQTHYPIGKKALDDRVMAAIKNVPRHEFLPPHYRYLAYTNGPAPIGLGQTISQSYPSIAAPMTGLLNTQSTDTVPEAGSGRGCNAS